MCEYKNFSIYYYERVPDFLPSWVFGSGTVGNTVIGEYHTESTGNKSLCSRMSEGITTVIFAIFI
jgi:hypothetical protein